jgi:hypothetical protein
LGIIIPIVSENLPFKVKGKAKGKQILLGDKNATSLCSKNISTLLLTIVVCFQSLDLPISTQTYQMTLNLHVIFFRG